MILFIIGFISGLSLAIILVLLINLAIKQRIKNGENLINYGNDLIRQKAIIQQQLNELTNG